MHACIHPWHLHLPLQVCNEVSGQEEDQDEGWGNVGTQREEYAFLGQHWGECFTIHGLNNNDNDNNNIII